VPNNADWDALLNFLDGWEVAGNKLKETGTKHLPSPNTDATNESGFTAFPTGVRGLDGTFALAIYRSYFWSITESTTVSAWIYPILYDRPEIDKTGEHKKTGLVVRCMRDY